MPPYGRESSGLLGCHCRQLDAEVANDAHNHFNDMNRMQRGKKYAQVHSTAHGLSPGG